MTKTPGEYNGKLIDEFRANEGRVGSVWEGTPLLLIHHIRPRSGLSRVTPVGHLSDNSRVASRAGEEPNRLFERGAARFPTPAEFARKIWLSSRRRREAYAIARGTVMKTRRKEPA